MGKLLKNNNIIIGTFPATYGTYAVSFKERIPYSQATNGLASMSNPVSLRGELGMISRMRTAMVALVVALVVMVVAGPAQATPISPKLSSP